MNRIHVLDQETIDRIAAGEAVERPASVAKELIENAIDAGSTRITIELRNGGIGMLRVTDNGRGISKEDIQEYRKKISPLLSCVMPQAKSRKRRI